MSRDIKKLFIETAIYFKDSIYTEQAHPVKMTEMPAWQDAHLKMDGETDYAFNNEDYDEALKRGELLDRKSLLKYSVELYKTQKLDSDRVDVFSINNENKEIVGRLITYITNNDYPRVSSVVVYKKHQRQGLGFLMYTMLIDKFGGCYSDRTLTGEDGGGSFKVWTDLGQKYNSYTVSRDKQTKKDIIVKVNGFSPDMMGDPNERFLVTTNPIPEDKLFDYAKHNSGRPLKEVQLMQHSGNHDIDSSDPNEWDFISGKTIINKKIGKDMVFIKMQVQHNKDVKYAIKDIKNKIIIAGMRAKIDSSDFKVKPTEAQITSVVTNPEYRGKGWGKLIYKLVLETEGTIVSDYQLYPGTYAIWKDYLPTIANVYNYNNERELEPFNPEKGVSKEGLYDYFIASKQKLL